MCARVFGSAGNAQNGGCYGSTEWGSSLLEGSWCEIFLWKTRKVTQKPEATGKKRTIPRPTFTGTDPECRSGKSLIFGFFHENRRGPHEPLARPPLTARTTARERLEEKTCSQETGNNGGSNDE